MKGTWPDRSKNKDWLNKGLKRPLSLTLWTKNIGVKLSLENSKNHLSFVWQVGWPKINTLWFIRWYVISTPFELPNAHSSIMLASWKAIKAKRQWSNGKRWKTHVHSSRLLKNFPWIQWFLVQEPAIPSAKQSAGPLWASSKKPVPIQTEFRHGGWRFDVWDPKSEMICPLHLYILPQLCCWCIFVHLRV